MKTIGVLIDFDNIFPKAINLYTVDNITCVLQKILDVVKVNIIDAEIIRIRLYGGWYMNTTPTQRASVVSSMLTSLNNSLFPIISSPYKRLLGSVDLAIQLYGQSYIWYNTFRERAGIPKLRIDHNAVGDKCDDDPETCPVKILKWFTEKKSRICKRPDCNTAHNSVFFERTQKYVDTMLACDIISMSMDSDIESVYVVSDDVDHFPAFAVSYHHPNAAASLRLIISNDYNEALYNSILTPFGVDIKCIEVNI